MRKTNALKKPLFRKLVILYYHFILPKWIIYSLLFYLIYGPEIIELLDFYNMEYRQTSKKLICFVLTIVCHIIFLVDFLNYQLNFFKQNILNQLLKIYIMYIASLNDYLILAIVAYYKYGTLQLLNQIYQDQLRIYPNIQETFVCQQIRLLAKHNRKLNHLISIEFWIFILAIGTCAQLLIGHTSLQLDLEYEFSFIIYMAFISVCFVCSIHFSMQIDQTLYNIREMLTENHWKTNSKKSKRDFCRYLFQVSLYRKDFQLNLFNCITIDYCFVMKFVLFIMSCNMIIIQTN